MMLLSLMMMDLNKIEEWALHLILLERVESLDDRMTRVVEVVVQLLKHNQVDVDRSQEEMEVQELEENQAWNRQIVAYGWKMQSVHAFVTNVSNKIHVVGILFDIDSFHIIVAIVFH